MTEPDRKAASPWWLSALFSLFGLAADEAASEVKQTGAVSPVLKVVLFVLGGVLTLLAILGFVLVYAMFSSPKGMGAERLIGPVVALFAFAFLVGGIGMIVLAIGKKRVAPPGS